jgi:hypothetical protein
MEGGVLGQRLDVGNAGGNSGGFGAEHLDIDLVNVDKGLYVDYASKINAMAFGFRSHILRSNATGGTSGADLNLAGSNYFSEGVRFGGRADAAGWSIGIDFLLQSLEPQSVPAWAANVRYNYGQIVSSGGLLYKAVQSNIASAPPSANWVQWTYAGTAAHAVGIDFSAVGDLTGIQSAIRLKEPMRIHLEATGAVGIFYSPAGPAIVFENQATGMNALISNVVTGDLGLGVAAVPVGAGAAAVLGNVVAGPPGPVNPNQVAWGSLYYNFVQYYIPLFQ